jgi:hypothetical protein
VSRNDVATAVSGSACRLRAKCDVLPASGRRQPALHCRYRAALVAFRTLSLRVNYDS